MSHGIEIINGVAQMAYVGQPAWHGLGTELPEGATPEEMLKAAGLDWEVLEIPLSAERNGKSINTGRKALVRSSDDSVLDVVSSNWHPVQNEEAFSFFNQFTETGGMQMDVAGSLKKGKLVWGLAKLTNAFEVFGSDRVESYLLFTNPHQFGRSINIRLVMERVVCRNTLAIAMRENATAEYSQTHRTKFDQEAAKATLGVVDSYMSTYREQAEALGAKRFTKESAADYFQELFPVYNNGERKQRKEVSKLAKLCLDYVELQPGAEIQAGTYWSLYNSVTHVLDHVAGKSDDSRLTSAWYGTGANKKDQALKLALAA